MFELEMDLECDGIKGAEAVSKHIIHGINDFVIETGKETVKWIEDLIEEVFEDIQARFPKRTGQTVKDIHMENFGDGHLQIWTDNIVVMYIEYGTKDHGPKTKPFLVFKTPDGRIIRTKWVRGIPAHYIIKLALDRLSQKIRSAQ